MLLEKAVKSITFLKKKYKIGLLVQSVNNFENFSSLYNAAKNDNRVEFIFIALGLHDGRMEENCNPGYLALKTRELLYAEYGLDSILAHDGNNYIDIESLGLDVIFVQTPYDTQRPCEFSSEVLSSVSRICYIPYGICIATCPQYHYGLDFFDFCWKIFLESDYSRAMAKRYLGHKKWSERKQRIIISGSPKLDKYLLYSNKKEESKKKTIIWAPHWTINWLDGKNGYSNFLKYKDLFLDLMKRYSNINFILRYHPLTESEIIKSGTLKKKELTIYLETFRSFPNGEIEDNQRSYWENFINSDAMITDGVSFLTEYAYSGKPLLYTEKLENGPGLNAYGEKIKEFLYVAHNQEQIELFVDNVAKGIDTRKEERNQSLKQLLVLNKYGNGSFIINQIKSHLFKERIKNLMAYIKRIFSIDFRCISNISSSFWASRSPKNWSFQHSFPQRSQKQEKFIKNFFVPKLKPHHTVLDLGCADGGMSSFLLPYCCHRIIGYDISKGFVMAARKRAQSFGWTNARFFKKDLTQLHNCVGQYNYIMALGLLTCITNKVNYQNIISSMYRLVKPGGYLVLKDTLAYGSTFSYIQGDYAAIYRNVDNYINDFLSLGFRVVAKEVLSEGNSPKAESYFLLMQKGFYNEIEG